METTTLEFLEYAMTSIQDYYTTFCLDVEKSAIIMYSCKHSYPIGKVSIFNKPSNVIKSGMAIV